MDPSALQERKWTFGKVTARQSVSVMGEGARSYLYVCTTFSVPMGELGFAHHAKGSGVQFADADTLTDDVGRRRLALEHMATLATELRLAANAFTITLSEDAAGKTPVHLESVAAS
jgi:hypothetical protein